MPNTSRDAPERAVQRLERLRGHRRILGPLERHREVIADLEPHALVQIPLALPPIERVAHAGIVRHFGGDDFVEADRFRQIALALDDLRQLRPRARQLRIEIERVLQMRLGFGVVAQQEFGGAGAEPQHRVLRIELRRFAERVGGGLEIRRP